MICVIEDEEAIADAVAARLRAEGFAVEVAHDGPAGIALCERLLPDLVILDLLLPGIDGLEVCRRIQRTRPLPVLMLTALDAETDMLVGLGVGADDYMTKPFSPRELVARVRALLRRVERRPPAAEALRVGALELDPAGRRVRVGGEEVALTADRVRPAGRARGAAGRGPHARPAAGRGVGLARRLGAAHGRLARARAAAQARPGVAAHRARRGLRAGAGRMRPLDFLPSIKAKLGVVIVAAVVATTAILAFGDELGMAPVAARRGRARRRPRGSSRRLARGMTSPLREMASAASAMARGDYERRVTATSRDEVGELARAFNAMAADLGDVERMRRDLVANVSHELRTPIGALQAVLENLADGVEDPHAVETALAQTQRLGRLVEQLLDLSRLESGTLPIASERFGVHELLDRAARECVLGDREVRLRIEVDPIGLEATGDPERLQQVLANLLDNAVRHSPPDGRVWLVAYNGGPNTTIAVCDEGPGIPPEEAQRVFERFYRTDHARSARDGGTGLGLAIARWIVDAHGGSIRAEEREPHGCRMVLDLPAAP